MKNGSLKCQSVAMAAILVTGCGGGSGGGSDGANSSTTKLTLDPQGYGDKPAVVRVQGDFSDATTAYSDINGVVSILEDVEDSLQIAPGDATIAATSAAVAESEPTCSNPSGVVKVDSTVGSSRESYVYTFENCQVATFAHGVLLLNGEYRSDFTVASGGDSATLVQAFDITGQELDSGRPLGIVGSQTSVIRDVSESSFSITTTSPAMEFLLGDKYVASRDSRISITQSSDLFTLSIETELVSSALGGYLAFSTPIAIAIEPMSDCPIRGHVVLQGDGKVEARYGQSTARGYGLEVLVNGSEVSYEDVCGAALPL